MKKSEKYAFLAAENLNHQVFFQFTVPTLITEGEIRLSRKSQFERLDKVVRNTIHGFNIEQVKIYDPEQVLTYSTDPEEIGRKEELGIALQSGIERPVNLASEHRRGVFYGL